MITDGVCSNFAFHKINDKEDLLIRLHCNLDITCFTSLIFFGTKKNTYTHTGRWRNGKAFTVWIHSGKCDVKIMIIIVVMSFGIMFPFILLWMKSYMKHEPWMCSVFILFGIISLKLVLRHLDTAFICDQRWTFNIELDTDFNQLLPIQSIEIWNLKCCFCAPFIAARRNSKNWSSC